MLAIMEVIGLPPRSLIAQATRRKVFFDDDYNPIIKPNSRGKLRKPGSKPLDMILKVADPDLVQFLIVSVFSFYFLQGCFEWKPDKRLKPHEALSTPWI
jgi:dual specificity tyrosine-phosphorylation-regulated kinase 2/3/4